MVSGVECGIPASIPGGKSRYSGIYFEDETTYECHDGYKLEGPQSVKCDINGNWGPTPKCTSTCKFWNILKWKGILTLFSSLENHR